MSLNSNEHKPKPRQPKVKQQVRNETSYISKQVLPRIQAKFECSDKPGQHFLVLSKDSSRSSQREDVITLKASQFRQEGPTWIREWEIKDRQSCHRLDHAGYFIPELTSISDLDSNHISESSAAYRLACSGDIGPEVLIAILREGQMKAAIRGISIVKSDRFPPEGGILTKDNILEKHPNFSTHLEAIWKMAAGF